MVINQTQLKERFLYDFLTGRFTRLPCSRKGRNSSLTGCVNNKGYTCIKILGKSYKAHLLAFLYMTGAFPTEVVDHIDGNPSNNAWSNLRECTLSQNQMNARLSKINTSGFKGVSLHKPTQKWMVTVRVNGKNVNFGIYKDIELADLVATETRNKYHGDYARHF